MGRLTLCTFLILLLLPAWASAGDASSPPLTAINVHSLGPEQVGNLPPVIAPVDNPQTSAKILLGKKLYFDTRLSADNTVSCATCHDPAMGWSDAGPTSKGIKDQLGGRRAPPVSNAAYAPLQFWDGRAPTLEEQAKGPIVNPIEMGNTHQVMINTLSGIQGYEAEFKAVFGTSPIRLDQAVQAIAAFERTVVTTDSPFDRYVRGDQTAMTTLEKKGLEIFNGKGHCTACHWGGYFSDGRFHNLGVAPAPGAKPDEGRYAVTKNPADMGSFKTPTVRDAAKRPPYLHNGTEKTLLSVIELYDRGGGTETANLDRLMVPLGLSEKEMTALEAFIKRAMVSLNPSVADEKPIPASELPK